MNDPLKRRMFRQPMNPNQAMGILASSPELMGAVQQRFANGGEVKGYQDGGVSFLDRLISQMGLTRDSKAQNRMTALEQYKENVLPQKSREAQTKAAEINSRLPVGGYNNPNLTPYKGRIKNILITNPDLKYNDNTGYFESKLESPVVQKLVEEKQKKEIEGDPDLLNKLVEEKDKAEKTTSDKFIPSDVTQGSTMADEINEVNKKGNEVKKKEAEDSKQEDVPDTFTAPTTDFEAEFKKLTNKQKNLEAKINNPQEAPKVATDFTKRLEKIDKIMSAKGKDISLEDVDKEARKIAGLEDNARYDKDRHTAFWMSLIKAGLATAAGESSNTLTNIAKGLQFGVESYGKDINQIDENEREDNKTLVNLKYKLLSDKKSAEVAERTLNLQYQTALMNAEQNQAQFESNQAYQRERDKINDAYRATTYELSLYKTMRDLGLSEKTFALNVQKFNSDQKYRLESKKQFEKNLNAKISQGLISDEAVKILTMGDRYATFDREAFEQGKGGVTLTPLGSKINELWLSGKYQGKMTNLMHSVDNAMKTQSYMGKTFESAEQAKAATLLWIEGGYAKSFGAIKDDIQLEPADVRRQKIIDEWFSKFTSQNKQPMSAEEYEKSLNK